MVSPISVSRRAFSPAIPRFAGGASPKSAEASANRELSQGVARFWPSLSTIALAGITSAGVGGAVASRCTGMDYGKQIAELTQKLSNLPLPKPMGWGQWVWEKVAVPGTAVLGLGGTAGAWLNRRFLGQLIDDTRRTFLAGETEAQDLVGLLSRANPVPEDPYQVINRAPRSIYNLFGLLR